MYVLLGLFAVLAVAVGILASVDIAGDTVAALAARTVKEQTGMQLSVREVRGNPIRGYTFSDVALASAEGRRIFEAKTLGAGVNFASLFRGDPRLSELSIGGVDMDLDTLVAEIEKLNLPESGGSGEIPIDRISLRNSRFTSKWGHIDVSDVGVKMERTLINLDVAGAVNGVSIKGTADADMQGENVSLNQVALNIGNGGRLNASGNVRPAAGPEGGTALDFQGSLKNLDVADVTAFWSEFLSSQDYDGRANVDFSIEGAGSNLLISANLDFNGRKMGGYPLENLTARMKYSDMRLTVESVKATSLGIPIEGSAAVAMKVGGVPSVMVKLDGSDAPLSELAKLYPALGKVDGKVDHFKADIQGPTNELSGTISLSAPSVVLMGKRISDLAVQIKLAKSDTANVNGKFKLEGAQAFIQGNIAKILTGANLNLTANLVDLDVKKIADLIPDGSKYALSGSLTADLTVKGKPAAPSVSGSLKSPKFSAMGYVLDKPSVSFAYDKDTLTLKDSSGTWDGLPIKLHGTVGPLTSKTPSVNMTAQLAFKPENLKQFVPDIASYKLQGNINAGVKITGKLPAPKIDLVASSPALSALGTVSVKNLEVTSAIAGDLSKLDNIDLNLKAGTLAAAGVGLQNIGATVKKAGQQVLIQNVSAQSGKGSVTGGGTVALRAKDATLSLVFDLKQLDLAPLAQSGGLGVPLTGVLTGKIGVSGPSSDPAITFSGNVPALSAAGFSLGNLVADISGNAKALKINSLKAEIGGAPLSATGTVALSDPFRADIDIAGTGLDLAALTATLPDMKDQVTGKADLKFKVSATSKGNSGSGTVTSPSVTLMGLKLANVNLPLALDGNSFKSSNGTVDFYGGKVTNNLAFDMGTMKFSDSLTAKGFDVNAVAQDGTGGLGGKITGQGNLSLKIDGSMAKDLTYSGSGQFDMGSGGISGFSGLDIVTRLHGVNAIRYTSVKAPLQIQTGKLILLKGATATAPDKDPLYKYARLPENGTITFDKKLALTAEGNVNFQLINALAGGALGGAGALVQGGTGLHEIFNSKNLESILKGAIQGGREAGEDADFRDVTVKVGGTFASPSVSLVKVGPDTRKQQNNSQTQTPTTTVSADAPPKQAKPEDVIRDKIIDAIKPQNKQEQQQPATQTPPAQQQNGEDTPQQEKKTPEKQIEDQLKKGLDNLFRKK